MNVENHQLKVVDKAGLWRGDILDLGAISGGHFRRCDIFDSVVIYNYIFFPRRFDRDCTHGDIWTWYRVQNVFVSIVTALWKSLSYTYKRLVYIYVDKHVV